MASVRSHNPYYGSAGGPAERQPARQGDGFEWLDEDDQQSGPFRVMITGLPVDEVADQDVKDLFAHTVGEANVMSARVLYDSDGLNLGIAFVTLRRASDAKRAYHSFNDKSIDGQSSQKVHIVYVVDPSRTLPNTILSQISPNIAPAPAPSNTSRLVDRIPVEAQQPPAPMPLQTERPQPTQPAAYSQQTVIPVPVPVHTQSIEPAVSASDKSGASQTQRAPPTGPRNSSSGPATPAGGKRGHSTTTNNNSNSGNNSNKTLLSRMNLSARLSPRIPENGNSRRSSGPAETAGDRLSQRFNKDPRVTSNRASPYPNKKPVSGAPGGAHVNSPKPDSKRIDRSKPRSQAELDEDLKRLARERKWGGGGMDTS